MLGSEAIYNFIINNQDLINEFYNTTGYNLEDYEEDLSLTQYVVKKEMPHTSLAEVMSEAMRLSVENETNVWEEVEKLTRRDNQDNDVTFNSTQQYFKEINDIYEKNNNNYDIEYCDENRDKLIEMNLKTVISIAKKYQGLGLTLNELISAGNLGLVIAYDKFDPSRSKLKDDIINSIDSLESEFTYEELVNAVKEYLTYGDIKKKFNDKFLPGNIYNKSYVLKWINSNVNNAKFNSIASMWIRAYILIEIDNSSRIVKKPKSEIYKDRDKDGAYKKEIVIDIDAPINDDSDTCIGDMICIEDDRKSDLEVSEAYDTFKDGINKLLDGVKSRDRSIFLKKFGIGLPRPMLPKEIAEQEGLSIARISQIFQTVIEQMQINQAKYDIDPDILFDAVKKIQ